MLLASAGLQRVSYFGSRGWGMVKERDDAGDG